MAEFMEECGVDFVAEVFFIVFGLRPDVFQKQNDLRWQCAVLFVRKFRPGEQPQRVRFDAVGLQRPVRHTLERDGQLFRPFAQRRGQRGKCGLHFGKREGLQFFPITRHGENLTQRRKGAKPRRITLQ